MTGHNGDNKERHEDQLLFMISNWIFDQIHRAKQNLGKGFFITSVYNTVYNTIE